MVVVVLPTPPFWLARAMTRGLRAPPSAADDIRRLLLGIRAIGGTDGVTIAAAHRPTASLMFHVEHFPGSSVLRMFHVEHSDVRSVFGMFHVEHSDGT
jgi:hypothetical protein